PFAMIDAGRFDRGILPLQNLVDIFLPSIGPDALMKISLRINKADAGQRDAQIAGFLAVVAGQNAETAGINRQRGVNSKLSREIGKLVGFQSREFALEPALTAASVTVEVL